MKKIGKQSICLIITFLIVFSIISGTVGVFAAEADNQTNDPNSVLQKNTKTATALDSNLETKINLSFPGKQEIEPTDIVFVVDKSGMSAQDDIYNQAKLFLEDVKKQTEEKGLNIKVGVVLFNMKGNVKQELTDVVTGYDEILNAMNSSVSMGTNMHAGLLAAKDILDKDGEVKAENKHVILISDGATYLYSKNGDYTKAYTRSFGDPRKQNNPKTGKPYLYGADRKGGIWESQSREYNTPNDFKKFEDGTNFVFSQAMTDSKKLGEYLDYYRGKNNDDAKNWSQYEYEYTFGSAYFGKGRKITPIDVDAPANIDIAFMETDKTFQEMFEAGYNMNVYFKNAADFDGTTFLKYMTRKSNNGKLNEDFDKLKKSVLDKISNGSYVEDYIGKDFDFINDIKKLKLNVGDEVLNAEKIDADKYGFGKDDNGEYRYVLEHKTERQAGVTVEKLILNINETVFPTKAVTLEYYEKLVNAPKKTGTYRYNTNESAILYPVAANGKKGNPMVFPVPELTYKYKSVEDKPTTKPDNNKTVTHVKNSAPRTGDSKDMAYSIILLGLAGALLAVLEIKRRKES